MESASKAQIPTEGGSSAVRQLGTLPSAHGQVAPAHVHAVPVHDPPTPAHSLVVPAHAAPMLTLPAPEPVHAAHSLPAPAHSLVVAAARPRPTVAESLVDTLVALGVEYAFAVFGGGIGPFCRALEGSPIRLMHYRHEAGAAFAAIEASLAGDKLVVVVATTGPGLTNLYTGMVAARWEGAKVLFVSGHTPAERRGRRAFQETSSQAPGMRDLFESGSVFHHAAVLEHPAELLATAAKLRRGVSQPSGFVAHLGLSLAQQMAPAPPSPRSPSIEIAAAGNDADAVTRCASLLAEDPFVIWAGFGARHAANEVRALAELTGSRVMCSPRGKGVFPENHPLYLGVTGLGGHTAVLDHMRRMTHGRVLVLGSQLGEMTSFWSEDLVPPGGIVHIDLDSNAFGAAYPHLPTHGFTADIRTFVGKLIEAWPARSEARPVPRRHGASHPLVPSPADALLPSVSLVAAAAPAGAANGRSPSDAPPAAVTRMGRAVAHAMDPHGGDASSADDAHGVRPSALMAAVQREIVEQTSAIVMTEAGNSYAFGSHCLRFEEPRYRSSTGFGAMGHATSGVLGAALASKRKAVAIVGDGALLMQNEINTAATYGIDAVWVVLNDGGYRMIAQGMRSVGWQPFETEFIRTDFVAIAGAMVADGVRVEREAELEPALARARAARGPFLVDVMIDAREQAPNGDRNRSLQRQGLAT